MQGLNHTFGVAATTMGTTSNATRLDIECLKRLSAIVSGPDLRFLLATAAAANTDARVDADLVDLGDVGDGGGGGVVMTLHMINSDS